MEEHDRLFGIRCIISWDRAIAAANVCGLVHRTGASLSKDAAADVPKASGIKEEAPDDEGGASRKVSLKVNHAATATYDKYVPCG